MTKKTIEQMIKEVKGKYPSRVRDITPSAEGEAICYVVRTAPNQEELRVYGGYDSVYDKKQGKYVKDLFEVKLLQDADSIRAFPRNLNYFGRRQVGSFWTFLEIEFRRPHSINTTKLDWQDPETGPYCFQASGDGPLPFD